MKLAVLAILSAGFVVSCSDQQATPTDADKLKSNTLPTQVLSLAKAEKETAEWGDFVKYFEGETRGIRDMLSGTAEIKPGMEIHPPHTHAEEEFLMVLEGEGTWTVGEENFPAKTGDMLYAAPWDSHGIKNTGTGTLKFVFWKWNSTGLETPPEPK